MPLLRLKDVADYVRTSKAGAVLLAVLRGAGHILDFTEERHNRLNRYMAVINAYQHTTMSVAEIAERFGCTKRTVFDYVEKAGIERRSFVPAAVKAAVLRDYRLKIPITKIMELHNVKRRYVHTVAREAGLRRYPPRTKT